MVQCYLCKGKLRVTRDKHVYDEKLKKRYHLKCFAGICRVCDMPVHAKAKHKVIGSNVWHEKCYARARKKRENPIKTIDTASWKAMVAARRVARIPRDKWREFETRYFKKHPPGFEEDGENPRSPAKEFWDKTYPEVLEGFKKKYPKAEAEERARKATAAIWHDKISPAKKAKYERMRRKREGRTNPMLVTPEQEADIAAAFQRVIHGIGTEADKALVRMAREADVIMSTGPSVLLKRNPETWVTTYICPAHGQVPSAEVAGPEFGPKHHYPINGMCGKVVKETERRAVRGEEGETLYLNPKERVDYIIQDEFGKVYETGTRTPEEAEARALVFNRKYMREFRVIYPKTEPADVKKAVEKATKELLKS